MTKEGSKKNRRVYTKGAESSGKNEKGKGKGSESRRKQKRVKEDDDDEYEEAESEESWRAFVMAWMMQMDMMLEGLAW